MDTQARSNAIRKAPRLLPRMWLAFGVLAIGAAIAALRPAAAQDAAELDLATTDELHEIVGPIALYPDDLVAIVLPASTYPLQIVQAARFLEDRAEDSSLQPNEDWDDSIVALLNYPEVVAMLDEDLDWTYDLGTAVLNQRADVLSAIQDFRDEAYAAGNLRSDERQTVASEGDTIEIKPADPKVIYIPYYEPERVVVHQPAPVYYYYPQPYPVYYYPYPAYYHFNTGFFWGVNTWFSIGWHSHYVHAYDPFYYGHPYYGHSYYSPFYVRNVYVDHYHHYPNYVWQPNHSAGGRPVVRGSEGRVYAADRAPRHGVLDSDAAATRTREGSANPTTGGARGGTATRATEGAATSARTANGAAQPRRGVTSSSYRNRTVDGTQQQAAEAAQVTRPTRAAPGSQAQTQARAQPQARQPSGAAQTETPRTPTSQPTYRSGGGMSQALERSRAMAQPNTQARTSPGVARANPGVSPRAYEGSTGMPRESTRSAPAQRQPAPSAPRESAPNVSAPRHGGGMSVQRSESGGGSHGNSGGSNSGGGNDGGGSYRGGGSERSSHAAARHAR